MKRLILTTLILGHTVFLFAQKTSDDNNLRKLTKLDLGPQGVGFTFEPRLSNKITVDLSVGIGGGYDISEDRVAYTWNIFNPAFYFSATPKLYYNRKKRLAKGKSTLHNSGNYIGLRLKYTTGSVASDNNLREAGLINLHWGMQRAIGKRWTFNAHVGGGYTQDIISGFGCIYPALDFKFSYVLL